MTFSPGPDAERRQIALLTGGPSLRQSFDAAMIRLSPSDQAMRLPPDQLAAVPVDRKQLLQAQEVFADEIGKSFSVDLADLSRDTWSLVPSIGNLLVEVRTRRYGTLTYAHDGGDQEDISLFDRARRRNLAIYSSRSKLATRGPFFDEDADAEVDVLDCNVETTLVPDRLWMEGRTRLRVRVRTFALSALTLRLAERLVVRSVSSESARTPAVHPRPQSKQPGGQSPGAAQPQRRADLDDQLRRTPRASRRGPREHGRCGAGADQRSWPSPRRSHTTSIATGATGTRRRRRTTTPRPPFVSPFRRPLPSSVPGRSQAARP